MADEPPFAPAKILVVDDAPQNVKLLRVLLRDAGYAIVEASNGQEALDRLRTEHPDVMILDVRMPGMSGYEVCRTVRHDPRYAGLPIIMVTALSLPEERIKGIEAGATDFITKPFSRKELLARLRTTLAFAQARCGLLTSQLPGALILATPDWQLILISPLAASLLDLAPLDDRRIDVAQLLRAYDVDLAALDAQAAREPWSFSLTPASTGIRLSATQTTVCDAAGLAVLHVIVLREAA
ncbi:MAG: response regulator [Betaproteobacteria bacterium]|nr:response regulator [Betaproteobacteria bacterium]